MNMINKNKFTPPSVLATKPLSRQRRRFLFLTLVAIFICAVPVFVFYASGYRYNFWDANPTITATGGLYLSVGNDAGEVFLDGEPVNDSRVFRQAMYIQGLVPGLQRLHVQATGYHTWVKELPVYPHIVTEASAFLMPKQPHLRPITEYVTSTGTPVYLTIASTTDLFAYASITVPILATSSKATSTLLINPEFFNVVSLFGTTSATSSPALIDRVVDGARNIFEGTASTSTSSLSVSTTTVVVGDTRLFKRDGDVYVRFQGVERNVPYYFCIPEEINASTSVRFEAQLIEARRTYAEERSRLAENLESDSIQTTTNTERACRREIKIDRGTSEVIFFTFFPGSTDLVLMHRTDGLYVTEVDDRAWQNSQQIYPDTASEVVVSDGRIFIKDGHYYFELITDLPTAP